MPEAVFEADCGRLPILSYVQVEALREAWKGGLSVTEVSLDLGLTSVTCSLNATGVELPTGARLDWEQLAEVSDHENLCFEVEGEELVAIRAYSEALRRTYQLMPTRAEPALLISGFVMHRIRDVTPSQGAKAMVQAVLPVRGRLLDTATGLGYAAIEAAAHANEVVSIELDPMAQAMARKNPWSRGLFGNPKIRQLIGNSAELVVNMPAESFAAVVHDPPAINLAGELYAAQFYAELFRVLGRGGRLFHYVGDPLSASGGRVTKGVVRRLLDVGFRKVVPKPEAFGVLALK